jgi:hypothetical protein
MVTRKLKGNDIDHYTRHTARLETTATC